MQILLDQGYKNIEDCVVGDKVVYYDLESGERKINEILKIESYTKDTKYGDDVPWNFYVINGKYRFFENQSIWSNNNVTHIKLLEVGDIIYNDNNEDIEVRSIEFIKESETDTFWRLSISNDHSYIADGITLHNADRYWNPSANNNWGNTSGWSATDGGTTGASVPTSADNVNFTSTNSYKCTVAATASCADLLFTGGTGFVGEFAGSSSLSCYGANLTLNAGMTFSYTGTLTVRKTSSTVLVTTAGKTIRSFTMNASTSTFRLVDDLRLGYNLTRTAGIFDPVTNSCAVIVDYATFSSSSFFIASAFTGTSAFYDLDIIGLAGKEYNVYVNANIEASGAFTAGGNSVTERLLVRSNTPGTARTITASTRSLSNIDFRDITASATWDLSSISAGNGGGNTNITFPTAIDCYFYTTADCNWSDSKWFSATSGGGSAVRVPLLHDNPIFDSSSFSTTGLTLTLDMPNIAKLDVENIPNSPTIQYVFSISLNIYGDLKLATSMTWITNNDSLYLYGRSTSNVIKTGGKAMPMNVNIYNPSGKYTLQDDFDMMAGYGTNQYYTLSIGYGEFDANDFDLNFSYFSATLSATMRMGNGTWYPYGAGSNMNIDASTTVYCEQSTIYYSFTASTVSRSFSLGGKTYYNFYYSGHSTAVVYISGNNTFNNFEIDKGYNGNKLIFTANSNQTINGDFIANGDATHVITLVSGTSGTQFTLTKTSGTINCDYLSLKDSNATGGATWNAGNNSTDVSNNTGWIWGSAVTYSITKSTRYTVLIVRSSSTKGLVYMIKRGPPTTTKSLIYAVKKIPSLTKLLQYIVVAPASPKTKSLKYYVTVAVAAKTKSLQYEIKTTHSAITKSLKYCIRKIGSNSPSKSLKYEIKITPSAKTKAAVYSIKITPASKEKTLVYKIKASAAAKTKGVIYKVVTLSTTKTKLLRYSITTTNATTKSLKYSIILINNVIAKSLNYIIRPSTSQTKSLVYKIKTNNSTTKDLGYNIKKIFSQTKTLVYIVKSPATIIKGLRYEIKTQTAITKSLQYKIYIVTTGSINKGLRYVIDVTVQALTKPIGYNIKTIKSVTKSFSYFVVKPKLVTKSLGYSVKMVPAVTKLSKYQIKKSNQAIKSLSYSIINPPISISKNLKYVVIRSLPTPTKSLKYQVLIADKKIIKNVSYSVKSHAAKQKALRYHIQQVYIGSIIKNFSYSVKINGCLQKTLAYAIMVFPYSNGLSKYNRNSSVYGQKNSVATAKNSIYSNKLSIYNNLKK